MKLHSNKIIRYGTVVLCVIIFTVALVVVRSRMVQVRDRESLASRCQQSTESVSKMQCWEDVVRESLKQSGVDDALRLIGDIYAKDGEFAQSCHAMVHIVGQSAYSQFKSSGKVPLSEQAASCAFGFYHGFMEMLIARKGAIEEARSFCAYVDKTLADITPNAKFGCYHGIGHGATDVHNPKYFGDERALIVPALATCEAFAQDRDQIKLCATGVFDSISIAYYNNGENGLIMKKEDPLWLCHEQPEKYKESCYLDMMPAVLWQGQQDLVKSAPIIFAHVEPQYQELALKTLADNSVRFIINKKPVTMYVPFCRTLPLKFQGPCVEGLAAGVMQFGPPGNEYEGALAFCREEEMSRPERDTCMKTVLDYSKGRYSKQKVASICSAAEEEYKKYCQ